MDILSDGCSTNGVSPAEDDETAEVSPQSELNLLNYRNGEQETLERMKMENGDIIKDFNSTTIMATKHTGSLVIKPKKQLTVTVGIARTITKDHPLMLSPTGKDSELDAGEAAFKNANNELQMNSYPDVIPRREHQQSPTTVIAMTMTMVNTNSNCQKRHNNSIATSIQNPTSKPQTHVNHNNKQTLLRTQSPDLLSSESDADISPYHAAVESNFQTVALIPNTISNIHTTTTNQNQQHYNIYNNHNNNHINNNHMTGQRHLELATKRMGEDISSLDSISNHSFDNEPNLASLSPSSSLMDIDALNENEDEDDVDLIGLPLPMQSSLEMQYTLADAATPTANSAVIDKLPQYSAHEERRDVRNWQKITLPNGSTREIDMRVIEPYKRVLSHGGYLKAGGHNAIVLFCACYLPDRSRTDYSYVMDNLFLYVVKTLEQLVTEDYVLIYLHGGSDRHSVPPFPWLKKCYQLIDRRLRKSLKNLYLVHPTFWLKSIVWMARPFLSTKFWRKLIYVKTLDELSEHVAVENAAIPEKVRKYDVKHC